MVSHLRNMTFGLVSQWCTYVLALVYRIVPVSHLTFILILMALRTFLWWFMGPLEVGRHRSWQLPPINWERKIVSKRWQLFYASWEPHPILPTFDILWGPSVNRYIPVYTVHFFAFHQFNIQTFLQLSFVYQEDPTEIPGDYKGIAGYFASLLHKARAEKPIYIFLDAVDQLSPEDGASGMSWLPLSLPPNVKIVLSTSSEVQYCCYPVLQSLLAKQQRNFVEVSY